MRLLVACLVIVLAGCDRGVEVPTPPEAQEPGGSLVDQSGPRDPGPDTIDATGQKAPASREAATQP